MEKVELAVLTVGNETYIGWQTPNHRCLKYGPFKTEEGARKVLEVLDKERLESEAVHVGLLFDEHANYFGE